MVPGREVETAGTIRDDLALGHGSRHVTTKGPVVHVIRRPGRASGDRQAWTSSRRAPGLVASLVLVSRAAVRRRSRAVAEGQLALTSEGPDTCDAGLYRYRRSLCLLSLAPPSAPSNSPITATAALEDKPSGELKCVYPAPDLHLSG
jgi:hypothetical protein